ncbi:hypothetical protein [Sphingomonas montana]|uniref:hypothetical protein n=1 Tax=Sphingomonas montana TaxID=1843236 RepID=UPI0013EDDA8E|nr:hypothetical protein [Sphingomonas montana]
MKNAILLATALVLSTIAASAPAQDGFAIAITVDDLPAHGPLPQDTDRASIARAYIATL